MRNADAEKHKEIRVSVIYLFISSCDDALKIRRDFIERSFVRVKVNAIATLTNATKRMEEERGRERERADLRDPLEPELCRRARVYVRGNGSGNGPARLGRFSKFVAALELVAAAYCQAIKRSWQKEGGGNKFMNAGTRGWLHSTRPVLDTLNCRSH